MKDQTLTTIDDLKPGDLFTPEGSDTTYIKIPGEPVVKYRMKFPFFGRPIGKKEVKHFRAKTPVIYLKKKVAI